MQQQMNGPAVAEQAGWQTRRVGRLPASASAYAALIEVLAAVAAVAALSDGIPAGYEWWRAALLLPLAAVAPMFRVAVGRNHSLHAAPAFVVAGTLVLPPALLVPLVLVMLVPQWLRDRYAWYIGLFNVANYTLSTLAAWAAVDLVRTDTDLGFAAAGLAAAVVFVAVNHLLLAVMLRLGRGHSFRQSGLFSATGLTMELVLAALGIAIGAAVLFNPWILPVLIAPLALAHRSLSTVALLRESEERFRTMFAAAPTAIMLFDRSGKILSVNRSAESLFGYSEQEMIGRLPTTFRHPDDADHGDEAFGQLIRGERDSYRREASFVTKSGATVVVHLATALVRDADGKPAYVIGMAEDVTEQRQLEEQLRQSQKLEAIGRLAGGVAHDFNNMLTAIGGYTALALDQAETGSTLRGDLDEIRKATDRAALLTRQLLAFSRKQVLMPELLNLNDVVLELEAMLRPLLGEDVTLTMQLDPGLGPIEADPGQLHQVVMNLVVNASDAMPNGGEITIATANCDVGENDDSIEPGHYVTLAVRDTGEGIDEQTLRQIFEPFFTTKDAGKGTGLGLATVYGIVKQTGGYVAVESELGIGSAFTLYLRRAAGHVQQRVEPEPARVVAEPVVVAATASTRVLVVEDEDVIRGLVDQVLRGEGYDVLLAADGDEAIALAGSNRVDVLLTDLTMPGIGGHELADRLRAGAPALKVLFMSGFAEGNDFSTSALPPATAFLEKPFTFTMLSERMRELVTPSST
ncbi:MAG TPA: PAS domain S-box protein [Gaiellaceae bacterium]|nr:PAS domain S-box protein [Gaiellaceae bacterium]